MNIPDSALKTTPTNGDSLKTAFTRVYPWIIIACCSLFLFYKYVLQISPSIMTGDLMRVFHVDGAGLGNLAAAYFYSYVVVQIAVGPLLDKYGLRLLSTLAIALSGLATMWFAHAGSLDAALIARALIGVGAAFATVCYMKAAAVWFKPERFAFVSGLLATAAMVGCMAGQAPMALLVDHAGWRDGLSYAGLCGIALAALFYFLVRDKRDRNGVKTATEHRPTVAWRSFLTVFKSRHNWWLLLYSGLAFSPVAVFGGLWGVPFLEESRHLAKANAAALTSMMFLGLAVGGPVLGFVSDRLGKRYGVMIFGLLLSFGCLTTVIYAPVVSSGAVGALLFLFGFGTGAFMLGFTVGRETNPVFLAATVMAMINTGDAIFGAFSEPLVGKVLDLFWEGKIINKVHYFTVRDFHWALAILPLYLLAACVFLRLLRRYLHQKMS